MNIKSLKYFIILNRIVLGIILGVFVFIPINYENKPVRLIYENVSYTYYESLNEASVDVYLSFNYECSGTIYISFFDANENIIVSNSENFYAFDKSATCYFFNIFGEPMYYEITFIDCDIEVPFSITVISAFTPIFLGLLISSFFLRIKKYIVEEKQIIVYAGWINNYLFVNNVLCDEYTGFSFSASYLNTILDNGIAVNVVISNFNNIVVKTDGKLIMEINDYNNK